MSSEQVACRRKRTLLRSIGSRRRHKNLSPPTSPTTEVTVLPAQPLRILGVANKSPKPQRQSQYVDKRCALVMDKEEEFASGSAQQTSPRLLDVERSPYGPDPGAETPPRTLMSLFATYPGALVPLERLERTSAARHLSRRTSLNVPRVSDELDTSRRDTTSSVQLEETADPVQEIDISTPNVDHGIVSTSKQAVEAHSRPSIDTCKFHAAGKGSSPATSPSGYNLEFSVEEINTKLAEMLAATVALKPTTPLSVRSSSRIFPRVTQSRMMTKMSGALGRMYNKSNSPDDSVPDKKHKPQIDHTRRMTSSTTNQANEATLVMSSTTMRLNEGGNLNRDKVQKIVGTLVPRKPVNPGRDISLRTPNDDLVCNNTTADLHEPGARAPSDNARPLTYSAYPFDLEEDFDCNLDQGLLRVPPAGSSTPRIRNAPELSSTLDKYAADDSSTMTRCQVNLARVVKMDKQKPKTPVRRLDLRSAVKREQGTNQGSRMPDMIRHVRTDDEGTSKKHPSPSKKALEELERALQAYKLSREPCSVDDTDELALSSGTLSSALAVKDRNKKMADQAVEAAADAACSKKECLRRMPSRIPRPLSKAVAGRRSQLRLASGCKPDDTFTDEMDELCNDRDILT